MPPGPPDGDTQQADDAAAALAAGMSAAVLDDLARAIERLPAARQIAIIGAGLVGCELAAELVQHGKSVTVVELRVDGPAVDIPPVGVPPSGSLTRGKPVSTGSNGRQRAWWHNPCPPHQAVDDSPLTRWRAEEGATTAWIQVDLGAAVNFDRAMIDDDDTVTAFEIQVLIGQDWKTVHSGGRIGQRRSVRFPPVTGRQVRLHILAARETPSIWEFQLY